MRKNKKKLTNVLKVATMATFEKPQNLDLFIFDGTGQMIPVSENICSNEALSSFFREKFPSYKLCSETKKMLISDKDALKFVNNSTEIISELSKDFQISEPNATVKVMQHIEQHDVLIQPTGLNAVLHRTQVWGAAAGSALYTTTSTAASHVSGLNGIQLLSTSPALLLAVPTTGAIFFAGMERFCPNTPVGKGFALARDVLLVPMAFTQVVCNKIVVGPILHRVGIDAPLNLTSYLKFGEGIKALDSQPIRKFLVAPAAKKIIQMLSKFT